MALDKKVKEDFAEFLPLLWTETDWESAEEYLMASLDEQPFEIVLERERRELIREFLSDLTAKQRMVLRMRFGILFHTALSLEEIGMLTGISKQAVWKTEQAALRKLRETISPRMFRVLCS